MGSIAILVLNLILVAWWYIGLSLKLPIILLSSYYSKIKPNMLKLILLCSKISCSVIANVRFLLAFVFIIT